MKQLLNSGHWIPAFAGMTGSDRAFICHSRESGNPEVDLTYILQITRDFFGVIGDELII